MDVNFYKLKLSLEMNFRVVKPVGISKLRFVPVPLVKWCLRRVVHSEMRFVNGIDNSHDLNYLGNSGKT